MTISRDKSMIQKMVVYALLCGLILVLFNCQRNHQVKNQTAAAKKNLVEIFYLPHPPAQAIVQKVEAILKNHPKYTGRKYNFFDAANKQKIADYKISEHSPIIIFIAGQSVFTIGNRTVNLKNFPKGDAFVPTFEGDWNYDDLEQLLK